MTKSQKKGHTCLSQDSDEYKELIEGIKNPDPKVKHTRHNFMSEDGMYLYFIGVIDYLQEYLWYKEGETKWKGNFNDIHQISSVPP